MSGGCKRGDMKEGRRPKDQETEERGVMKGGEDGREILGADVLEGGREDE